MCAIAAADAGAKVVVNDINVEAAERVVKENKGSVGDDIFVLFAEIAVDHGQFYLIRIFPAVPADKAHFFVVKGISVHLD